MRKIYDYGKIKSLYLDDKYSPNDIAKMYGLKHRTTIKNILQRMGVLRTQSEAAILAFKKGKKNYAISKLIESAKTTNRFNPEKARWGEDNPKYLPVGSKRLTGHGYILVKVNPTGRWKYEHRLVMEKELNRPLEKAESIHHKDLNKQNNNFENLQLTNQSEHNKIHHQLKKYALSQFKATQIPF